MAMNQGGALDWEAFRERLIERIAEAERRGGELAEDGDGSLYYERWMAALTEVLVESGMVGAGELRERIREYRTGARREVY
jgi:hypothetical protein